MVCRQCGTEIAEKAIICFKCGAATAAPAARRADAPRPRAGIPVWIWAILAGAVAAFLYARWR